MVPGRSYSTAQADPTEPTGGWRYGNDDETSTTSRWGQGTTTASVTVIYDNYATTARETLELVEWSVTRSMSREAQEWMVKRGRQKSPPPLAAKARFGHQQMCRLPCYRGVRIR